RAVDGDRVVLADRDRGRAAGDRRARRVVAYRHLERVVGLVGVGVAVGAARADGKLARRRGGGGGAGRGGAVAPVDGGAEVVTGVGRVGGGERRHLAGDGNAFQRRQRIGRHRQRVILADRDSVGDRLGGGARRVVADRDRDVLRPLVGVN